MSECEMRPAATDSEQLESPMVSEAVASNGSVTASASRPYKQRLVWKNIILMSTLHISALYGVWLLLSSAMWATWLWVYVLYLAGGLGITAGAHRLWAHKAYSATLPLRVVLMIFNCTAFQNDVIEWSRDHRTHHKFSETDADPHNANRGLFFSHVGWLLCRKHPDVIEKGKCVKLDDLFADPVLRFQRKYYPALVTLFCFVLPTIVPHVAWGESLWTAYFTAATFRYAFLLNVTWTVNSVAHYFGSKPYDRAIGPTQSLTAILFAVGEGWHNYHHTFPSDYRASEYPWRLNVTTMFIDFFAKIGWVYDRKLTGPDTIAKKRERCGKAGTRMAYIYG